MDLTNLRAINDLKAENALSEKRHQELLISSAQVQDTVLSAVTSLIKYLEGHTTKTEVVNQLRSINTPDVFNVVKAIEILDGTVKEGKPDFTPLIEVMGRVESQLQELPREFPTYEQRDSVSVDNLKGIEDNLLSVKNAVDGLELHVDAPVVNVDKPDLKPIKESLTKVVDAVKSIKFPEIPVTDVTGVEKELKNLGKTLGLLDKGQAKANKTLIKIADKPVSRGGGGGGRATPYQDSNGIPAFVTLTGGAVPISGSLTSTPAKDTDRFGIQAVSDDGTYKYFFFEADDADYYIMRKHKTNKTFTYTAGTGGYAAVYVSSSAGPSGSPTWADRGATFPV
jgi:hypothetical protein